MTIFVTGGSGFIGKRLIDDLLKEGHHVHNFDPSSSTSHPELTTIGDVLDLDALSDAVKGSSAIIHLAAEHRDDVRPVERYYRVNVDGARQITAAAERNDIKTIVFTSTVAIYGLDVGVPSETSVPQPFNDYGRSKLQGEAVFQAWADADPARTLVIIRPSVVFGETNRGNVYTLLKQMQSGRFLQIGNGKNRKSMAYVGNVARFIASTLALPAGTHVFNYADKPDLTTDELIGIACEAFGAKRPMKIPYVAGLASGYLFDGVARLTGRTFPISSIRVKKFCADTQIDTNRIEALGITRPYTLAEGLNRTVSHDFLRKPQ